MGFIGMVFMACAVVCMISKSPDYAVAFGVLAIAAEINACKK